jgi:xanthine dehydrogenase accessory factor
VKLETLAEVNVERAARRPVIVVTDTANGEQRLVKAADIATDPLGMPSSRSSSAWARARMVEFDGKKLFLNVYAPTAQNS